MLLGEGVTAIWNSVLPESRADFLDWHMREHMAERVALPGFSRARRHVALDSATAPAFFTLYEAATLSVLQGQEYRNRIDEPTAWTRRVMPTLRGTARALAGVVATHGPGLGGVMLTLRFGGEPSAAVVELLPTIASLPGIAGAHCCVTDLETSSAPSTERMARGADVAPPTCFILIEAADESALADVLTDAALARAGMPQPQARGLYRLEFLRSAADS